MSSGAAGSARRLFLPADWVLASVATGEGVTMKPIQGALAALTLLFAAPAWAADPASASGHYDRDATHIVLSHAVALDQDNTEGMLDHGPQVRVLLADREVPVDALYGIVFPPVRAMASRGEVRGLLLEFDPADRTSLHVTILDKPAQAGDLLTSLSLSDSTGLWRSLTRTPGRIAGDFQAKDGADVVFSFSVPLATDPVVADLKGAQAQSSDPVKALIGRATALSRGDLPAALALTARAARPDLAAIPPDELKQLSGQAAEMIAAIQAVQRVVVRQHTAAALMGEGSWSSLVFEDGGWKVAD